MRHGITGREIVERRQRKKKNKVWMSGVSEREPVKPGRGARKGEY